MWRLNQAPSAVLMMTSGAGITCPSIVLLPMLHVLATSSLLEGLLVRLLMSCYLFQDLFFLLGWAKHNDIDCQCRCSFPRSFCLVYYCFSRRWIFFSVPMDLSKKHSSFVDVGPYVKRNSISSISLLLQFNYPLKSPKLMRMAPVCFKRKMQDTCF